MPLVGSKDQNLTVIINRLLRRLKQLDRISRRVVEDHLGTAGTRRDVVSEMDARGFEPIDL